MKSRRPTLLVCGVLALVAIGGIFIYWTMQRQYDSEDVDAVEHLIGQHYLLPDEKPALATVEDKTKLSSEFLRSAENGDKLLVYAKAKKVILYRPSIDRIVEVGPISIAPANGTSEQ